jgi:hypothetical protein
MFIVASLASCGIKGDGEVKVIKREAGSFDGVDLNLPGKVVLIPGLKNEITIEAQDNIAEVLTTNIVDNTLVLEFSKTVKSFDKLVIYITAPTFRQLKITGSGEMETQSQINCTDLLTEITGSGVAKLDIKCNKITSEISGSGTLQLMGTAETGDFEVTGSGTLAATKMQLTSIDVEVTGSGSADVYATTDLKANVTGSGTVNYIGDPEVKSDVTGSGAVNHTVR